MTVTTAMRPTVLAQMTLLAAGGFAGGPGIWACGWMRAFDIGLAKLGKVDGRRARFDTALLQRLRLVQRPRYRRGTGGPARRSSDPIDVLTVPWRA